MTILKPMQLVITTMLLLVCSTISFGQKLEPKDRKTEPEHTISSKIRGEIINCTFLFLQIIRHKTPSLIPFCMFWTVSMLFPQPEEQEKFWIGETK
jgi:hypothetical protein